MASPSKFAPKLTQEARDFAINCLAQWETYNGTVQAIQREHNITISLSAIAQLAQRNAEKIKEAREEYLADFQDTPLAYSKMRLREYVEIYEAAKKETPQNMHYMTKALEGIREEMAAIRLPQAAHGTIKEAIEFINGLVPFISSGQANPGKVQ